MRSMQQQLGNLGTILAFTCRQKESKKNLCRGGRSQDLPDIDFQPAVRQLKKKQQYTHSITNTHKMTTIHRRQIELTKNACKENNTKRRKYCIEFVIFFHNIAHRLFTTTLRLSPLYHPYIPFPLHPAFTPSLRYTSLHFPSLHYTSLHFTTLFTLLDDFRFTSLPFATLLNGFQHTLFFFNSHQ